MDMTKRKFSRRIKIEAVRLVMDRGVAVSQAARDLDLSVYTQHDLDQVALRLNTRLRKTLGFETLVDTFKRALALNS